MKYELFYSDGDHEGPYEGKAAALKAAKGFLGGAGDKLSLYIDIVPYSQPWEATPRRDFHLLRGVERVYAKPPRYAADRTSCPTFLVAGREVPVMPEGTWYSEQYETLADKKFAERNGPQEPNPEHWLGKSRADRCYHIVSCAITPEQRERAIEMMRSGNPSDATIGAAALGGPCVRPKESIYVMKKGRLTFYARRTTKRPKYLRWELQLPSGALTRWKTLKEIKERYRGTWRKTQ